MNSEKGASPEVPMREWVRQRDWAGTPLGPADRWPQSLRTLVELCLDSKVPSVIYWGPERVQIHNDSYRALLGIPRHPKAPGRAEIWPLLEPLITSVFRTGEAVWTEASHVAVERHGTLEEAYFTCSLTPVRDESGSVGGIFGTLAEVTPQVLSFRRLSALRELAESRAVRVEEACAAAVAAFARQGHDLPFALIYKLGDSSGRTAPLCGQTGFEPSLPASLEKISLDGADPWHLDEALKTGAPVVLRDLGQRLGRLPGGPWPEPAHTAVVLPIESPGGTRPFGFLVAGLSPRRALDEAYFDFLRGAVRQLSSSLASARACEEERTRAEKLAEVDRLKMALLSKEIDGFSYSVSHDLRAPLRVIDGYTQMLLQDQSGMLDDEGKRRLGKVVEGAQKMDRMINGLLELSRLGRAELRAEVVDMTALAQATLKAVLSGCPERKIAVHLTPLPRAWGDSALLKQVLTHLIGNAVKFTAPRQDAAIEIAGREETAENLYFVKDNGVGFDMHYVHKLFGVFQRLHSSSEFEGTGAGLALVRGLVQRHGGRVWAESEGGKGATFYFTLPRKDGER